MSQFTRAETGTNANQRSYYGNLLLGAGILWLLLAAALLIYQANDPAKVEITWETATEQQTAGFYLYKSSEPDQGFVRINEGQLIASQGGPVLGASYSFIDNEVAGGNTYYYVLEEVELDGSQNRYEDEVFAYTVPAVNWWIAALSMGSALIGMVMFGSGLKDKRSHEHTNEPA